MALTGTLTDQIAALKKQGAAKDREIVALRRAQNPTDWLGINFGRDPWLVGAGIVVGWALAN